MKDTTTVHQPFCHLWDAKFDPTTQEVWFQFITRIVTWGWRQVDLPGTVSTKKDTSHTTDEFVVSVVWLIDIQKFLWSKLLGYAT
jgi:hypothetical protein